MFWASTSIGQLRVGQSLYVGLPLPPPGAAAPCALTNGIVAYWAFDNTYTDSWGLGGTLTPGAGTVFGSGFLKQSMENSTGHGASVADSTPLHFADGSYTLSFWVRPEITSYGVVANKGASGHDTFWIYINTSDFEFALDDGGANSAVVKTLVNPTPVAGTWYNVVCVWNAVAQTINIYQDGVANVPVSFAHVPSVNAGPLIIGTYEDGSGHFQGEIDEAIVWTNRALTSLEVSAEYAAMQLGHTPLDFCSTSVQRSTVIFNGDSRFQGHHNAVVDQWEYFATNTWAVNHHAYTLVTNAEYVQYMGDPINFPAMTNQYSYITGFLGTGTNVYLVTECGINDLILDLSSSNRLNTTYTNYLRQTTSGGFRAIPWTTYDVIVGSTDYNTPISYLNHALTNTPSLFGKFDAASYLRPTNGWYTPDDSELNDAGNFMLSTNFHNYMNSLVP